jgi:hypothetical protein
MSNLKLLKIINPLMAIAFLSAAVGIILLKFPIIPSLNGSGVIYKMHIIGGQLFILLAIIHITLNWNWIKSHIFGIKAKPKSKKK